MKAGSLVITIHIHHQESLRRSAHYIKHHRLNFPSLPTSIYNHQAYPKSDKEVSLHKSNLIIFIKYYIKPNLLAVPC